MRLRDAPQEFPVGERLLSSGQIAVARTLVLACPIGLISQCARTNGKCIGTHLARAAHHYCFEWLGSRGEPGGIGKYTAGAAEKDEE